MIENPYQTPRCASAETQLGDNARERSRQSLRLALLVLLIPAAYNYWSIDSLFLTTRQTSGQQLWMRTSNISAIVVGITLIWFFGLAILERISRLLRYLFALNTDQRAWNEVLYQSLVWAPAFAIPGALLWVLWVIGFYQMKMDFHDISWKLGVPMHLLASGWYLSLVIRWYRLAQTDFALPRK